MKEKDYSKMIDFVMKEEEEYVRELIKILLISSEENYTTLDICRQSGYSLGFVRRVLYLLEYKYKIIHIDNNKVLHINLCDLESKYNYYKTICFNGIVRHY